jgi:hypothetical protein
MTVKQITVLAGVVHRDRGLYKVKHPSRQSKYMCRETQAHAGKVKNARQETQKHAGKCT